MLPLSATTEDLTTQLAAAASQTGMAVQLSLEAGYYALTTGLLFNETAVAAEVVLRAAPGAAVVLRPPAADSGRRLQGDMSTGALLTVTTGVLTLERIEIRDAVDAPAVVVTGGLLKLRECSLVNNRPAGAVRVLGGDLVIEDSSLTDNGVPSGMGGALTVHGGSVVARRTSFARNHGAVHLTSGSVTLAAGTLLQQNRASMRLDGGSLRYELPAPLGRWVLATNGLAQLDSSYDGDYPYECAPGVFGSSLAQDAQSGPGCSGACPAGSFCPSLSTAPIACPVGSHCAAGSGSPTACPSGAFGGAQNLTSETDCESCPAGFWCGSGRRIACGRGTFNSATGADDQSYCTRCPPNSNTAAEGQTSQAGCICDAGYYGQLGVHGQISCTTCPVGSDCSQPGTTLETMPLLAGYYRASNSSDDLRRCPDFGNSSGCTGGVLTAGEGPCKQWLQGPYCKLCNVSDTTRFYDARKSACLPCDDDETGLSVVAFGSVAFVVVVVALLWARYRPHRRVVLLARLTLRLSRLDAHLHLRAKAKLLLSFFQVATRISDVYEVSMPMEVTLLLSVFEVFNVNIAGIGLPLQCLGLGSYQQQLLTTMLLPVVLAAALVAGFAVRSCCVRKRGRLAGGMLDALPWLLGETFLVFPVVSSAAFRAFSCEAFDGGKMYLRADYAVECDGAEHDAVKRLAWLGILLYPIGVSLLYAALLLRARPAILEKQQTALSKALGFLVRDYEPGFFWWELLEAWKKLFLVGFAVLILPGSVEQLLIAFLFSLVYMLLVSVTMPFRDAMDDYFAKACAVSLTTLFFFSVVLKFASLTVEVEGVLTQRLRDRFSFDVAIVTVGMITSVLAALLLAALIAAAQVVTAARLPMLKLVATKAAPDLPLRLGQRWHLFLSHVWGTGQDQCATIKRQLCALLPGVLIFLDVDDLKSVDDLEEYVDQSAVISIFVSKGYFKSGNCLREARFTVAKRKPIALVHDGDKAGMSVGDIRRDECPDDLRSSIFDGRDVIEWHRIKEFQLISLKLLAEQLVCGCAVPQGDGGSPGGSGAASTAATAATAASPSSSSSPQHFRLYLPGEASRQRRTFHAPVPLVYASPHNPGALEAAQALQAGMGTGATFRFTTDDVSLRPAASRHQHHHHHHRHAHHHHNSPNGQSRSVGAGAAAAGAAAAGEGAAEGPHRHAHRSSARGEATHFLLYLNQATFVGGHGSLLAAELREARAAGAPAVVMVHETDVTRGGCEFATFFSTTPQDLIRDGLYKALALALYSGPFWPASVALVARALGAAEARRGAHSAFRTSEAIREPQQLSAAASLQPPSSAPQPPTSPNGAHNLSSAAKFHSTISLDDGSDDESIEPSHNATRKSMMEAERENGSIGESSKSTPGRFTCRKQPQKPSRPPAKDLPSPALTRRVKSLKLLSKISGRLSACGAADAERKQVASGAERGLNPCAVCAGGPDAPPFDHNDALSV